MAADYLVIKGWLDAPAALRGPCPVGNDGKLRAGPLALHSPENWDDELVAVGDLDALSDWLDADAPFDDAPNPPELK